MRGRGARDKTIMFALFKPRGRVDLATVIHSNGWRGYNGLLDLGYKKHYRVEHGKN